MPKLLNIKVTGVHRVIKNLHRISKEIPKKSRATTKSVTEWGGKFAKAIAPKQTGALIRAITFESGGKTRAVWGKIESNQPKRTSSYHRMMHGLDMPDISGRIKSGDPHYMFTTATVLKKNYPKQMARAIKLAIRP